MTGYGWQQAINKRLEAADNLSKSERSLVMALALNINGDGVSRPTQQRLSARTGMTTATISAASKSLARKGWFLDWRDTPPRNSRGQYENYVYRFNPVCVGAGMAATDTGDEHRMRRESPPYTSGASSRIRGDGQEPNRNQVHEPKDLYQQLYERNRGFYNKHGRPQPHTSEGCETEDFPAAPTRHAGEEKMAAA